MLKTKCRWGTFLEDIHAEPFPEFHHALLMTRRTEVAALAGKCQEIFMAAVFAFHTGKTVVQIPAIEITMDHLLDIGPPETVLMSLACYIATLVIVRGRHVPIAPSPQVPWAEIEYPDSKQVVERTIKCYGSAKGLSKNMHLWLAVEERNFIWPKEGEIFVIDGQWKGKIYEDGVADQFGISLLMADSKAHKFIQDWLDAGRRGEGYSTLSGIEGATRIARVDELRLKPKT